MCWSAGGMVGGTLYLSSWLSVRGVRWETRAASLDIVARLSRRCALSICPPAY